MRQEIQTKTRHIIPTEKILKLGAEPLGFVNSRNTYIKGPGEATRRIRIEGDVYHYTQKSAETGEGVVRKKQVEDLVVSEAEAKKLIRDNGIVEIVDISCWMFQFLGGIISLDRVNGLGTFLEVSGVDSEAQIATILKALGVNESECFNDSYLDLMVKAKIPAWKKTILRQHKKISELTFGLISGIMTSCGVLAGAFFLSPTKLVVVGGLMIVAVSDSLSEGFGMHSAKLTEGMKQKDALKHGFYTVFGNVIIPVIFLIPVLLLRLDVAIEVDLGIGGLILIILNTLDSLATNQGIVLRALRSLAIAAVIVVLSTLGGKAVSAVFS